MTNRLPENMRNKITVARILGCPIAGECWVWTGCVNSRKYGCATIGGGVVQLTHRIAYTIYKGEIPEGYHVDHLCFNTRCCNPAHLEAVTPKVNAERGRNATKKRCIHGHPLAGANLLLRRRTNGLYMRQCRVCVLDAGRRQADKERKGIRQPSANWSVKRQAKRSYLIAAGEVALRQNEGRIA